MLFFPTFFDPPSIDGQPVVLAQETGNIQPDAKILIIFGQSFVLHNEP